MFSQRLFKYLLLIFLIIICTLNEIKSFKIEIIGEDLHNVTNTAELKCKIDEIANDKFSILWKKVSPEEILIAVNSKPPHKFESRYNTFGDNSSSTVQIKDLQETDAGEYECELIYGINKSVKQRRTLQIRTAPKISNISVSPTPALEVIRVEFECTASSVPNPTVSWTRENNRMLPIKTISPGISKYIIESVRKEDRGIYYCYADNGNIASQWITFDVSFAPMISTPRPRTAQSIGYSIDLICEIEAHPAPAINWYKNDKEILSENSYSVSKMATKGGYTTSMLHIYSVESHHYGDYYCNASNSIGSARSRLNLFEAFIPVPSNN